MNSSKGNPAGLSMAVAERAHRRASGGELGDISIYIQMRVCNAQMTDRLARLLAPHGMTNSGYFAMMSLCGRPDNLANPSELCDVTGETRGNMTRICDELVDKGWMRRVTNPEDRRRVDLSLTDEGLAVLNVLAPELKRSADDFYRKTFTAEEKATLQALLARFSDSLGAD